MEFFAKTTEAPTMQKPNWIVPISECAGNTVNEIRRIVETMKIEPNPNLNFISLSIGDPTVFGNLNPPEEVVNAVSESLLSGKHNGYNAAAGSLAAREAVAKYASTPDSPLTNKDVVLTSGCSHAIELALEALANRGDNILIPIPGFSIYNTLAGSRGVEARTYNLLSERDWEVDLDQMESLIDNKTKCIIVNNPSNPCGSVYSKEHLIKILEVAEKYHLPIVADEIYAHFVFKGEVYHSMAALTKSVPVLSVGAISKRFLVPGWRLGWILIHDRNNAFINVRQGLQDLASKIVGPNSIIQGAMPAILSKTPESFFENTINYIEKIADICYQRLSAVPGLRPVKPRGAMYMMVGMDEDLVKCAGPAFEFTQRLISEKSVFCLPGSCFGCPNFFRVVVTAPEDLMRTACERIDEFCREILDSRATNGSLNGKAH